MTWIMFLLLKWVQSEYKVNVIIRVHIKAKPEPYCLQVSKMRRTKHKIITHISGHENGKPKRPSWLEPHDSRHEANDNRHTTPLKLLRVPTGGSIGGVFRSDFLELLWLV